MGKKPTVSNNQQLPDLVPPDGMKVVQTKKNKVKQLIPIDETYVYQSNKVTLSKYRTTLLLERLLTLIQYELQEAVKHSMKGDSDYSQLDLFDEKGEHIVIKIPLRNITKANSLDDVIETCKGLMDLKISFASFADAGKVEYLSLRQAVHGVDIPIRSESMIKKGKNAGSVRQNRDNVIITMTRDQADRFILVDYNQQTKRPMRFTKYLLHTAVNAKTKYTSKMYKLIASWAVKGKFAVAVDWLKEYLDIKGKDDKGKDFDLYPYFSDLKKRVLDPVKKELFRQADCWFEYAPAQQDGRKVTSIRFTVITPDLEKQRNEAQDYIRHLLRTHYDFNTVDFKAVKGLFEPDIDPQSVLLKLQSLNSVYHEKRAEIINKKGWAVVSLQNFLTGKGE